MASNLHFGDQLLFLLIRASTREKFAPNIACPQFCAIMALDTLGPNGIPIKNRT
jgi:hypothetical protein